MKQRATNNLHFYIGILLLFVLLKYLYTLSTNDQLLFLLAPTNTGITLATGSTATYLPATGFVHHHLPIVIDKSCAGFNFWLLSFTIFSLTTLHYYKRFSHKLLACAALLVISYAVTLFVNISRILTAILTLKYKKQYTGLNQEWMHEAQGAFIYLLFLVVLYLSIQYLTAKLTQSNAYSR